MRGFAFYRSVVGKKAVMAVTGVIMVAFVVGHLLGNLLVFRGSGEAINAYGALLKSNGALLWGVRLTLLAAVVLHAVAATQLTLLAQAARPVAYAVRVPQVSTLASRTMRWGGVLLAVFIVMHLLHFTLGVIHPDFSEHDVYHNVIVGFRVWYVSLFYIVAMVALGAHLYHGVWSSPRSVGIAMPTGNPLKRRVATVLAAVVWLGFTSIPVAVLAGVIQ